MLLKSEFEHLSLGPAHAGLPKLLPQPNISHILLVSVTCPARACELSVSCLKGAVMVWLPSISGAEGGDWAGSETITSGCKSSSIPTSCVTSGFTFPRLSFPICTTGLIMIPTSEVPRKTNGANECASLTVLLGHVSARCSDYETGAQRDLPKTCPGRVDPGAVVSVSLAYHPNE